MASPATTRDALEEPRIDVSVRWLPFGKREVCYEWIGDPRRPIRLSVSEIDRAGGFNEDEFLTCFPFPLRRIEAQWRYGEALYMRTDVGHGLHALWGKWKAKARFSGRRLKRRLLVTAAVWNLAKSQDWNPAKSQESEILEWKHVFAVSRILAFYKTCGTKWKERKARGNSDTPSATG